MCIFRKHCLDASRGEAAGRGRAQPTGPRLRREDAQPTAGGAELLSCSELGTADALLTLHFFFLLGEQECLVVEADREQDRERVREREQTAQVCGSSCHGTASAAAAVR